MVIGRAHFLSGFEVGFMWSGLSAFLQSKKYRKSENYMKISKYVHQIWTVSAMKYIVKQNTQTEKTLY